MGRANRLIEVVQILGAAEKPITAQHLAELLEVTTRTIYRDMVTLQSRRIPVEGSAGVGYVMRGAADLSSLWMTVEEMDAIVVGLSMVNRTSDQQLKKAAEEVFAKLSGVMPRGLRKKPNQQFLYVSNGHIMPPSSVDESVLRSAIRAESKLLIRYKDCDDKVTERRVCPLALIYFVDCMILAVWCEMRNDFRHFRLDRIQGCTLTGAVFSGAGAALRNRWKNENRFNFSELTETQIL